MATSKSYRAMPSSNISKFSNDNSGLLTTVADLPYNFKLQYVSVETPLDLSLKSVLGQITPPHSPQRSPLKKRPYHHIIDTSNGDTDNDIKAQTSNPDEAEAPAKLIKKEITPNGKQIKVTSMPKTQKSVSVNKTIGATSTSTAADAVAAATTTAAVAATAAAAEAGVPSTKVPLPTAAGAPSATVKEHKRVKAVRKLKFDEKKSSPVSGTIIRALDEIDGNIPQESGDIDPQYNIVEVTDEAKAEIAAIPNVIGAYLCKLCQIEFDDAFCLARHRCSCIVLLEYRCPECGKRFNCPANLASHRRWHKPKDEVMKKSSDTSGSGNSNGVGNTGNGGGGVSGGDSSAGDENAVQYPCTLCGKFFKRQAYLRKHLVTHNKPNSKTNKRAIQLASDSNDGGKSGNSIGSNSNTTAINTRIGSSSSNAAAAATSTTTTISGRRSKSVCSDDSVSSSQDSLASTNTGVRFTFNVNSSSSSSSAAAKAAAAAAVEHVSNSHEATAYMAQSSRSPTHFRLFKSEIFTEEENIAAAALAHLRHAKDSVIRHTTALST